MSDQKRKWWELNLTNDEREFFESLARNPSYVWRNVRRFAKELGWDMNKLSSIAQVHVNNKLVLVKTDKRGEKNIAYWERVEPIRKSAKKKLSQKRHSKMGNTLSSPKRVGIGGTPVTPTTGSGTTPTGTGTSAPPAGAQGSGGAMPCSTGSYSPTYTPLPWSYYTPNWTPYRT